MFKLIENSKFGNDIMLNNLGPVALFSIFKLTTSSGKHLEDISHAQIIPLIYKLITSAENKDVLSIGFDRSRNGRKDELAQKK